MEVEWVTRSMYSGDPGVARRHFIFLSFCHTIKIHTLFFPSLCLTCSFRDFVDLRNCVDQHGRVESYLPTFLCSSNLNRSPWQFLFGCCDGYSGMMMVGSRPSCSVVSPQWPPSGASQGSLNWRLHVLLQLCLTTICGESDHISIYRDT
jgi:hypothetical protein